MSKGADTRRLILDEATRLASSVGLTGLTIGSLARQTHLSKSGLFAHFQSKESLQIQVLDHAAARFVDHVIVPARVAGRGVPRLRALFERWLDWTSAALPGGCLFMAASGELDDRPGPVRDHLAQREREWLDTLAHLVRTGVSVGHLQPDTDPDQFAQDLYGVLLAYRHAQRLLHDPGAEARARRAFETLLDAATMPSH